MSFGAVAGEYDRLRPSPPSEAVDWLLPARRDVVVDLAAGTGLLTRALAGKVGHVIAVEPDERMRSVLQARSGDVEVLAGRGEAIPLPDASADAVFVSSAWHWMDPERAVPEISRVLRDGGRFGVISTGREPGIEWLHADQWFAEARTERSATGQQPTGAPPPEGPAHEIPADEIPADEVPADERIPDGERRQVQLPDRTLFTNIETHVFRFSRYMPVPDIVDMLGTYSGVITASRELRDIGRARAAAALAEQFPGAAELEVPMRSRCWRADRVSRAAT
ncbi:MAG TPA: class I SAM-dependent methyltransferase [Streptosporangiaceae bacterium]|nr:class I SAM-dependent methyltransferase [Streptosporangiaceae bacterium]